MGALKKSLLAAVVLGLVLFPACAGKEISPETGVAFVSASGLEFFAFGSGETRLLLSGPGISSPRFSSDGKWIFYNAGSDLFCLSMETGEKKLAAKNARLAGFANGRAVALSPEYGVSAYDPAQNAFETLVSQPEGGFVAAAALSNDGKRIAYTVCTQTVGQVFLREFKVVSLSDGEGCSFSENDFGGAGHMTPLPLAWAESDSALLLAYGPLRDRGQRSLLYLLLVDGAPAALRKDIGTAANAEKLFSAAKNAAALPVTRDGAEHASALRVDLADFKSEYLPSGEAAVDGVSVSPDGAAVAYTAGAGLFAFVNGKTLAICGGDYNEFTCPAYSSDGLRIYTLKPGAEGAQFCSSPSNSAGVTELFPGVKPPSASAGQVWADMFAVFDGIAE